MAKVIIPDKICPHCGGNEWYTRKNGYVICNTLLNEQNRKSMRKWRKNNPEENRKRCTKYRSESKEVAKITQQKRVRKNIDELSDQYIKALIQSSTGLGFGEISQDQVIEYRKLTLARREFKKLPLKTRRHIRAARDYKRDIVMIHQKYKQNVDNLTDSYIKGYYSSVLRCDGIIRLPKEVTPEEIIKSRAHLKKVRTLKKVRQMETPKSTTKQSALPTKEMSHKEKQDIYQQRYTEKKNAAKLALSVHTSQEELEATALIGTEPPINEPPINELVNSEENIVDEFKRIEARRQEILEEVEIFNNYVESFKIKLS